MARPSTGVTYEVEHFESLQDLVGATVGPGATELLLVVAG